MRITVRSEGGLLSVRGQPGRPQGGVGRLRGRPQFGQGERLAVVRQRVLLQLADGHGGEGARQALVGVLLTWVQRK